MEGATAQLIFLKLLQNKVFQSYLLLRLGWDQKEAIHHLIEKAGCAYSETIVPTIQLVRYQTEKRSLLYSEYAQLLKEKGRKNLIK